MGSGVFQSQEYVLPVFICACIKITEAIIWPTEITAGLSEENENVDDGQLF